MIVIPRLLLYGPRNDNIYMGMMSTAHLFSVGTVDHKHQRWATMPQKSEAVFYSYVSKHLR